MIHQIKSYLQWLPKTFRLHGIHSPFVFKLQQECLLDTSNKDVYADLIRFRKSVFTNNTTLNIEDYGAGSRVMKTNKRTVKQLASNAGATFKRMKLLYRLVTYRKPKAVLELGTSVGLGTISMASGNPNTSITTVEGSKEIHALAKASLSSFNNITCKHQVFTSYIEQLPSNETFDLIYVDGHHDGDATINYINKLLPHATSNCVFILDDIYWSKSMTTAWKLLTHRQEFQVSIDCFFLGLLIIRPDQVKEHFNIRL